MMMTTLRLGTRGSPLALAQAKLAAAALKSIGISCDILTFKTTGDKITHIPLYDIGGKALFSKELERALLENEIDFAVHSLKDLETPRPSGLGIAAYLPRADARDVCVIRFDEKKIYGVSFQDLPHASRVGTCSPRRTVIIQEARPDITVEPIRGNVQTRLSKLLDTEDSKGLDAVIIAKAGLDRLGYIIEDTSVIPIEDMVPAAGQGIIAIECRSDDLSTKNILEKINCESALFEARIERHFVESLGASCKSAVGVHIDSKQGKAYTFVDGSFGQNHSEYKSFDFERMNSDKIVAKLLEK